MRAARCTPPFLLIYFSMSWLSFPLTACTKNIRHTIKCKNGASCLYFRVYDHSVQREGYATAVQQSMRSHHGDRDKVEEIDLVISGGGMRVRPLVFPVSFLSFMCNRKGLFLYWRFPRFEGIRTRKSLSSAADEWCVRRSLVCCVQGTIQHNQADGKALSIYS